MHLPSTFQNRLILTYLIISVLVIVFLGIFVDWILEKDAINHLRESLVSQANLSAELIEIAKLERKDIDSLDAIAKKIKALNQCRITIIAIDGQVLGDSNEPRENIPQMENHLYRPEVKQAVAGEPGSSIRYSDTLKQNMLYVAIPLLKSKIQIPNSKIVSSSAGAVVHPSSVVGVIRLAVPLQAVVELRWSVRKVVLIGAVIAFLLSLFIGIIIARSVTKPIKEINRISAQYTNGEFGKKIYVDSVSEINRLADTLNHMADQIQSKIGLIQKDKNETIAILNSMIEGVIAVGKNTRVISMNPAVSRIFEVNQEEGSEKLLIETIRNNELNDIAVQVLKSGQNLTQEIQILVPVERTIEIIGSPLFENQEIQGCVLIIHDLTQLRRLESVRKEFVENVSHELKTPLTSIKGYVETLLDGAIDDSANSRRFLQIIEQHAKRLTRLVDDILQLSELESKEISLDFQSVYLEPLLVEIMPIFSRELNRKSIQVSTKIPEFISPMNANRDKLKEVLINLLDNAIKFNVENGKIEIIAEQANREVTVTVADTGIGIPEKDMPRIFERFYRVDKTRSRELGGTGLGLSIVKHIIEQHNGTISVTSEVGKGTQFRFSIPKR